MIAVKHICVKFGDPRCISFLRFRAEKQIDRQTQLKSLPVTTASVIITKLKTINI